MLLPNPEASRALIDTVIEKIDKAIRGLNSLEALEETLTAALRFYWEPPKALVQLTAYPWWRDGVRYITTLSE